MATIEERAAAWVRANYTTEYLAHQDEGFREALEEAYLAGAGQARSDEAEHRAHQAKLMASWSDAAVAAHVRRSVQ